MGKVLAIGFALAGIAVSMSTLAQMPPTYLDGNRYHRLDDEQRATYLAGVVDGLVGSYLLDGNMKRGVGLGTCIRNMPNDQARDIVDKYVSENPEQRDLPMNMLAYNALNDACRKRGISIHSTR